MLNINILFVTDDKFVFIEVQIIESICPLLLFYNNTFYACSLPVSLSGIKCRASLAL